MGNRMLLLASFCSVFIMTSIMKTTTSRGVSLGQWHSALYPRGGYSGYYWQPRAESRPGDLKLVCYFASWASMRRGAGRFDIEDIDPTLCTHLIYGFAALSYESKIKSINPKYDLKDNQGKGAYQRFTGLKRFNPRLKTLISVGGWNEGSVKYSYMASRKELRTAFIDSCLEFLDKHGFDGLDLAWEYPAARGGASDDKQNFVTLLQEMRAKFNKRRYILSIAVSAKKPVVDAGYNIPQVAQYVDFINVMSFDYHGSWENVTGHHAPLYARPHGAKESVIFNANYSINHWISLGAPRNKLVMGIASYGRTFHLASPDDNGIGAPAPMSGPPGPYTEEGGSIGYFEICEMLTKGNWIVFRDQDFVAPYATLGRNWMSYDDRHSTEVKVDFAKSNKLGGVMIWSLDTDDFRGMCHQEKFPLVKAANRALKESPAPGSTRIPPTPPSTVAKKWERPKTTTSTHKTTSQPTSTSRGWSTSNSPQTWWSTASTAKWTPSSTTRQTWWPISSSTQKTWWPASSSSPTTRLSSTTTSTTQKPWWSPSTTQQTWWPKPSTTKSSTLTTPSTKNTTQQTWWPRPSTTTGWSRPSTRKSTPRLTSTTKRTTTSTTVSPVAGSTTAALDLPCEYPGLHAHPNYCNRFYSCVRDVDNKYRVFEYRCPPKTFFDKNMKSCRWAREGEYCKDIV